MTYDETTYNQPPLGVSPSWFVIPHRIKELADAISRYTEHERICKDKEVSSVIRQWAVEIENHCDTLDKIQDVKINTMK